MSFTLQIVKNGKDIILYNSHKYRENYSVKCGDIIWRCLGKYCKASIVTNGDKTIIHESKGSHSGQHPVTMRSLVSTPPQPNRRAISTPSEDKNTSINAIIPMSTPIIRSENTPSHCSEELDSRSSQSNLVAENLALREELEKLRLERNAVLDHSIESDQRLLKFTENVFLAHSERDIDATNPFPVSHRGTQTESLNQTHVSISDHNSIVNKLSNSNKELENKIKAAESKIKELEKLLTSSKDPCNKCNILTSECNNMIASIKCLEAEVESLKVFARLPAISNTSNGSDFRVGLTNRFEALLGPDLIDEGENSAFTKVSNKRKLHNKPKISSYNKNNTNHEKTKRKTTNIIPNNSETISDSKTKAKISFRNVSVVGDSHARHLSNFIQSLVQPTTKVTGMCKPGAGLLNIAPTSSPPPGNCYVLMGGTNDVATGKENIIIRGLEEILQHSSSSSSVLLMSLPPRYDLPQNSPIHRIIDKTNHFMAELCKRHAGVQMLNMNNIERRHYTRHGLHLRATGKRELAKLIVARLSKMTPRIPDTVVTSQGSPISLEHESYAAAVVGTRLTNSEPTQQTPTSHAILGDFLGATIQGSPQLRKQIV